MKQILILSAISIWLTAPQLCLRVAAGIGDPSGLVQRPQVQSVEGHWSPVSARITYRDGKSRSVMVAAAGMSGTGNRDTHRLLAIGEGNSQVFLWLDSIRQIKVANDKEFTLLSKSGAERDLTIESFAWDGLYVVNDDESGEWIKIANVRLIEFLGAVRKDARGFAMFDHWKYSPFTGEKLPELQR